MREASEGLHVEVKIAVSQYSSPALSVKCLIVTHLDPALTKTVRAINYQVLSQMNQLMPREWEVNHLILGHVLSDQRTNDFPSNLGAPLPRLYGHCYRIFGRFLVIVAHMKIKKRDVLFFTLVTLERR